MRRLFAMLLVTLTLIVSGASAQAAATVRAVLFYSPNCGHCHTVMTQHLPPLQQKYGDQLLILLINVDEEQGAALYREAIETYAIPELQRGVPTMIVGDNVLVGSVDIPQQLPGLIETLLAQGGNDWPRLPSLAAALPEEVASEPFTPVTPPATAAVAETPPFLRDMPANALAVLVLSGMVVVVIWAAISWLRPGDALPGWRDRVIPLLTIAGIAVSGYLAFIETTGKEAICGPLGDCNIVQQSEFAKLFGILPIGVAGVIGYAAILGAWLITHAMRGVWGERAAMALPALAFAGTLFSIYLTFLEPFVIGATCAWCLTSGVIITALLWLSMPYRNHHAKAQAAVQRGHAAHGGRRR